jgi:hypothetical protein
MTMREAGLRVSIQKGMHSLTSVDLPVCGGSVTRSLSYWFPSPVHTWPMSRVWDRMWKPWGSR